jgi:hypothetical protein
MEQQYGFISLELEDFRAWIKQHQVARTLLYVQQHHTFLPDYSHFTGTNHAELQRNMQRVHRTQNGWADIAQHFTVFPDGRILTGRSLEKAPAGIYGFNQHAICIENLGNFDLGGDVMRQEQRVAVVGLTAALVERFSIPPTSRHIVYHHWFDLATGQRTNGSGRTKSCPGTAFMGGNKLVDAEQYFLPMVRSAMPTSQTESRSPLLYYAAVSSSTAPIRNQPSRSGKKINLVEHGAVLRIYDSHRGWLRLSAQEEEWIWGGAVGRVERAVVSAPQLNIRSGPGTQFRIVGSILEGQDVFVYERSATWFRISPEPGGWVAARYLAMV